MKEMGMPGMPLGNASKVEKFPEDISGDKLIADAMIDIEGGVKSKENKGEDLDSDAVTFVKNKQLVGTKHGSFAGESGESRPWEEKKPKSSTAGGGVLGKISRL